MPLNLDDLCGIKGFWLKPGHVRKNLCCAYPLRFAVFETPATEGPRTCCPNMAGVSGFLENPRELREVRPIPLFCHGKMVATARVWDLGQ